MPKITTHQIKRVSVFLLVLVGVISTFTYFRIANNQIERETACFSALAQVLESGAAPELVLQNDLAVLQLLVEQSLVARSVMLEVSNRVASHKNRPISSADLFILKSGTETYLEIREELYNVAHAYECAANVAESELASFGVDPTQRLKALMLSLGAALTLYDNYMPGILLFEQDDRLRKILNDPDTGFGLIANKLTEATFAANSIEIRQRARAAIEFYENEKFSIENAHEDSDFAYLVHLIESSPSYNYVKKIRIGEIASKKFVAFERITQDMLDEAGAESLDVVSGLFGNTVGLFETRKGKLHGDTAARRNIQSVLQPLDILLEKTPFRLTDKLIPGHFGHVAIWTGTKAELIDADVWDDLLVQQYASQLSSNTDADSKDEKQVIEALRNGVQLNTLEDFMNVDDIAVLRPVFPDDTGKDLSRQALLLAFRQIGKEYDFNFDVNTTDKIVCSELAYVTFPSVDWPTMKTLGRHSISPDHVATLARHNIPLKLLMFYHDGQLIEEGAQVAKMQELMRR